ncbi:hypothetical protein [Psychroflexus sp. MBR-150]
MSTHKTIHIAKSHHPSLHQKLQKSMSLPTLKTKQNRRKPAGNNVYKQ